MHSEHAEAAEQSGADQQPSLIPDETPPAANGAQPLGRVIAVGGAQVTVAFSTAALLSHDDGTDVTVGTFLGISNGNSFIIGALCEVTLENTTDGGARAVGRMDLLGEIVICSGRRALPPRGDGLSPHRQRHCPDRRR